MPSPRVPIPPAIPRIFGSRSSPPLATPPVAITYKFPGVPTFKINGRSNDKGKKLLL
jgi:hypothetical protein